MNHRQRSHIARRVGLGLAGVLLVAGCLGARAAPAEAEPAGDAVAAGEEVSRRSEAYVPPSRELQELARALNKRARELDRREHALEAREVDLKAIEARLQQRLEGLQALREEISQLLERLEATEDDKVLKLIAMSETMRAKEAAPFLVALDPELAVRVLDGMMGAKAGKALAAMSPTDAARLAERMTRVDPIPPLGAP